MSISACTKKAVAAAALAGACTWVPAAPAATRFIDPLDVPARMSPMAATSQLTAVAMAGKRIVAVGWRGHVVYTDDGSTWTQAEVPVSADLTAVYFVSGKVGWALGHGGVVLRTDDAGRTWRRQLDGRAASAQMIAYYKKKASAGVEAASRLVEDLEITWKYGPEQPWLGIYFANESEGIITGPFGLAMHTADGGRSWTPVMERFDNPEGLHLNQVRRVGDRILVASERGTVFQAETVQGPFVRSTSGYKGSFFGTCGVSGHVLAFGLRGGIFHSGDGAKSWSRVPIELTDAIVGCAISGKNAWLASQGGRMLSIDLSEQIVRVGRSKGAGTFFDIAVDGRGGLVIVGPKGALAMSMGMAVE